MKTSKTPPRFNSSYLYSAAILVFGVGYSCSSDSDEPTGPDPERVPTLQASAQCAIDGIGNFDGTLGALVEATGEWASTPDDGEKKSAAQDAWKASMSAWQIVEVMRFGPTGSSSKLADGGVIGGQDLGDQIYSWPTSNPCAIDQAIVAQSYDDLEGAGVNVRGLDALGYLLFYDGEESSCPTTVNIIQDGEWDAVEDKVERRAAYASALAQEVQTFSSELIKEWDAFRSDFEDAGNNDTYPAQNVAIDDLVNAVLYLDKQVKDYKLGCPLAEDSCPVSPGPDEAENFYSLVNLDSLAQNLAAFETLWTGCGDGAQGLGALLEIEGGAALRTDVEDALSAAQEALEALEEDDLNAAITADKAAVDTLYDRVKDLTDLLKNQLAIDLNAELRTSGGDND